MFVVTSWPNFKQTIVVCHWPNIYGDIIFQWLVMILKLISGSLLSVVIQLLQFFKLYPQAAKQPQASFLSGLRLFPYYELLGLSYPRASLNRSFLG